MIVMKFGGSSLADVPALERVAGIVESRLARRPLVVVSAHKGVTDDLLGAARAARKGGVEAAAPFLERLRRKHAEIAAGVGLDEQVPRALLDELETVIRGVDLLRELTPRTLDYVASFGERLSARGLAALFRQRGTKAEAFDAWDLGLTTDGRFGRALPVPESEAAIGAAVAAIPEGTLPVVTGYIARDRRGRVNTLGRNGSDYSAAIFGAGVGAEEVEIWTDVSGVLTADPRVVEQARPVAELSFDEAAEVAVYGAKVVHPATLEPAVRRDVPIRVLNTFEPDHPGTRITRDGSDGSGDHPVKAIAHKGGQTLVNVRTTRMLGQHGFLAKLARAFARHEVVVDMIATSEVSVSVTVPPARNLEIVLADLRKIGEVTAEPNRTELCVVGSRLRETKGVAARVFAAVADADVNIEMISQGASRLNIGLVVADEDAPAALRSLHRAFFG